MTAKEWTEEREAKQCGNSAHIQLPKRFRGELFHVELLGNRTVKPLPMPTCRECRSTHVTLHHKHEESAKCNGCGWEGRANALDYVEKGDSGEN